MVDYLLYNIYEYSSYSTYKKSNSFPNDCQITLCKEAWTNSIS